MSLTHLRLAALTLLTTLVSGGAGCTLEASGTGLDDSSSSALDDRDGGSDSPTASQPPPGRDASVQPSRPAPDAAAPADAGSPVGDAEAEPGDAAVSPRDAEPPPDVREPRDAGRPGRDAGSVRDAGSEGPVARCGARGGVRCAPDAFCNFEPDAECGALDRGGVCESRPDVCTQIYSPVCGCDNVTYPSACAAHALGVSVKRASACGVEECQAAGGRVRGNGNGNGCQRARAQWEIVSGGQTSTCCIPLPSDGPPPVPAGRTCGGLAGKTCAAGSFCNYEREAGGLGCGVADGTGVCETQPAACTREYSPVCGCDGQTYPTACVAHAQGISVLRGGACE